MGVESVIIGTSIITAYMLYLYNKTTENDKKTMKKIFEEKRKEILEQQQKRKEMEKRNEQVRIRKILDLGYELLED